MPIRPTEMATKAEVNAMKAALDLRRKDHVRLRALLAALCCGLRKCEARRLRVGDFRKIDGTWALTPRTAKQRSGEPQRVIPFVDGDDIKAIVRYIAQEHGDEPDADKKLFWTAGTRHPFKKTALTDKYVSYHLAWLREQAGIERRLTSHSFRHGFATRLLRGGADLRSVQYLMGHKSIKSCESYLHVSTELCLQAVTAIQ